MKIQRLVRAAFVPLFLAACSPGGSGHPGDAGKLTTDAGSPDDSGNSNDAGQPTTDAGSPGDSGNASDSGLPTTDAGSPDSPPNYDWTQWLDPLDAPPDSEYVVAADGTIVTDSVTGLIWQRAVPAGTYTWSSSAAAGSAQAYCQGLSLGPNTSGWRLPSMVELVSIVDVNSYNPGIDSSAFPGTASNWFWASSSSARDAAFAWVVNFDDGGASSVNISHGNSVRCVRNRSGLMH